MAKKISLNVLSLSSIKEAKKELEAYRDSLDSKCEELCKRLCQEGIAAAWAQIGSSGFGKYIRITSTLEPEKAGCKAVLYMDDTQKIVSQWQTLEGVQSKIMSPMLLLEFGAGLPAQNPMNIPGVGTGTYGEHGTEPEWWYMDLDGEWHRSTGTAPKMPMYYASKEIREKVVTIAKEVFK